MQMKKIRPIVLWTLALLTILALAIFIVVGSHLLREAAPAEIKYTDVVVIVLTALSLMVTILGIGLAVMAVIGWATFESKLRDSSFSYFAEQLGKDGPLRRELESLLVEISLQGVDKAPQEQEPEGPVLDGEYVD
jgi:hypothetical protein